jgi:hypothetical protein
MRSALRGWIVIALIWIGTCTGVAAYATRFYWSDTALELDFWVHRADFVRLVAMAREDLHMTRIAPDFTWLDDDASWPRQNVGIPEERWDEYRRLFRRVNASEGIMEHPELSAVYFPIASVGLVPAGWTKGIVYTSIALSPTVESLHGRIAQNLYQGSHVVVYHRIEDHWYIYYEEW